MTTQRKARGAYSVGQATRESILSAAMVLIAERGYNGFSLRDLGRRVGISHPAVVYHFPSKEAILRSAIQRHEEMNALFDVSINEEAEGGFDEGGITAGSFVDWAVGEMRFAMKPGADAAIALDCVLWAESSSETHPAHAHYKYRTQQMEEALTAMIQAFVDEEGAEIGTTPRTLARILIRYWYGSVVSARSCACLRTTCCSSGPRSPRRSRKFTRVRCVRSAKRPLQPPRQVRLRLRRPPRDRPTAVL